MALHEASSMAAPATAKRWQTVISGRLPHWILPGYAMPAGERQGR